MLRFFLDNRLVAFLLLAAIAVAGVVVAPFEFGVTGLPRAPIAVDAIPDIGENQQIVFTRWPGRSPQDVEDQVTYPLTSALLGVPGVRSVRSNSMFGFSSIYLIFEEDVEFYWSRSRVLEKLNSLPGGVLPEGATPTLGPDATALGQVYWYTLEGRDPVSGEPVGGFDLDELRSVQDFYVRYGLSAAEGVAEVASIGGYVREYQVDLDPETMRVYGVTMEQVMRAVQGSNLDVGASTLEINLAEYFVRGLGYIKDPSDLTQAVIRSERNVPLTLGQVARVNVGPAQRRGLLDKSGAEAVGGVVIARYGANPLAVIDNVKARIAELAPGLPTREVDGRQSRVTVVPFYDRSRLIGETIGTLEEALTLEVLITAIVVLLMLLNLRSSLLVAGLLPVAVMGCFVAMKVFGVDANIVALSGIAIAIGTMVDMGIVLTESIVNRLDDPPPGEGLTDSIHAATKEVAGAVLTAVATTVVSFLPVFTMEAAEGKLFRPLAYTKTFALVAAILVTLALLPALARVVFGVRLPGRLTPKLDPRIRTAVSIVLAVVLAYLLAAEWMPLGVQASTLLNFAFVALVAGGLIAAFGGVIRVYEPVLRFLLRVKWLFLVVIGLIIFAGFRVYQTTGEEFMPTLGEGTFLLMPTSMPHAGVQENLRNLRTLDMAVQAIPEVELVVGKAGRADTPLDPAPLSMYENVIQYASEYRTDADGKRVRFAYNEDAGEYLRDSFGGLIPDDDGRYFRQWRDHIRSPDDIWDEIARVTQLPGVTGAPKLQPIETRLVMLQTGMRAPMGIKVYGADLDVIQDFGVRLEALLKDVEGVKDGAVFADRIVGKPYLLLEVDRAAIARYGLAVTDVQRTLQAAVGGMTMTTTVEGRERYAVRLRYPRELRDDPQSLSRILVATPAGAQIPLGQLVDIRYEQGPQSIKSEDGFLVGYVLFDRLEGYAEVEVVEAAEALLTERIASGALTVPPGISYAFAGTYEQQVRASERLALVVPIALALIFLILYLQFRSTAVSLMVFSGVAVAFAGGFLMIGAYDTPWFLDFEVFGTNLRDLFQVGTVNLSVAVWVGFLALFGIATDDGVLVATFLQDSFRQNEPQTTAEIRDAVVEGGQRRVRPAMMTTATTILALLPVLTSTGRGAEIMVPMAIPSFGGMALQVLTMFTVPVLYSAYQEGRLWWRKRGPSLGRRPSLPTILLAVVMAASTGFALSAHAQVPPAVSNASSTANFRPPTLDSLLSIALSQNPSLRVLRLEAEAGALRVDQVTALPDLELGAGAFVLPVETRVGPQRLRVGATQMLPWPGLREARGQLALAQSRPVLAQAAAEALNLRYQVARGYYQLARIDAVLEQIGLQDELYATRREVSLGRVEAGQGSTVDVYRLDIAREALEARQEALRAERMAVRTRLAALTNAGTVAALSPPSPEELLADTLPLPALLDVLAVDLAAATALIPADHPLLDVYERQRAIAQQIITVSELDARPDFAVGFDYIVTAERDVAELDGNGRDAFIPRVGLRVPLSRKPYTAQAAEQHVRLDRLDAAAENTRLMLLADAAAAHADIVAARARLRTIDNRLISLDAALAVATAEYANGRRAFDEVLAFEEQRLALSIERVEARAQILTARAALAQTLAL